MERRADPEVDRRAEVGVRSFGIAAGHLGATDRLAGTIGVVRSLLFGGAPPRDRHQGRARATVGPFLGPVLGRLAQGWYAVHDVPVGERSIDHVVVGPGGVVALVTRTLSGEVELRPDGVHHDGRCTDLVKATSEAAARAADRLSAALGRTLEVRGALAILVDAWTFDGRPDEVYVGSPRTVKDWIARLPMSLRSAEILEVARAASAPSTWVA